MPIAAKAGANDGPGMWIPAGVLGSIALLPAAGRRGLDRGAGTTAQQDGDDDDRR